MDFWSHVSRIIIKGRYFILVLLAAITYFLATQMQYMRFSYTEANLLPENHPVNIQYNKFLKLFGEEGNLIVMAVQDSTIFTPKKFKAWTQLSKKLDSFPEIDFSLGIGDVKVLKKDKTKQKFDIVPLYTKEPNTTKEILSIKNKLYNKLPFYENLLYNKKAKTLRTIIYLKKDIVNTVVRKDFIFNVLNPAIKNFEKENNIKVHVSGMPYIRTMNAQNIIDEIGLFVGLALGVTSLIFFFFFRSIRATFIAFLVVGIGVIWAFGFIGLFRYEISVLMALIPPLIIVIGVPNAIFLINKYQQEIKKHGNQAKSLQRVITKIGNATLMTSTTTAIGFLTFAFTKSELLRQFGIIASINIFGIFLLALLLIPIIYSFLPPPKEKHLKHLDRKWIESIVKGLILIVKNHRIAVYLTTVALIIISMIGIYMIRVSGSLIEDMPKGKPFFKDIVFFEKEFGGIMPLEIIIDTKKKNGVMKLSTLKRMNKLEETINEIPQLSKPISILNLVKYAKQAFYNGNPAFYQLPNNQEKNWILNYTKNSISNTNLLNNYVDSTGRYARITTFMKDIGTDKMDIIETQIAQKVAKVFPKDKFNVTLTGKALVFLKGTHYLIYNLVISLSLAILFIALFMAMMFRSFKMILISLIPNIFPLLITAGLMGYLGIPIKPSTILVFSIAFGISVDDTIHFLAKYRQELKINNWKITPSVLAALKETGVSMFYTSIVLFFGFLVFTASSFGGTKALGGLVSITLLIAMVSNLILLPSLLLSLEKSIANKEDFKEPTLDILPPEDENNNF
ncbi:MMPL family transporter [Lutibacter sp.]|uniref:efflux RND transporter permease subunit n=1 Tax=Lutibacter sp. TaxID=1925666 RepID=UPI0025C5DF32|nr:MMPL family transporter [Lutibacter sp.]MCF6180401.1 MMPL family transporter [Lutibacter sp.]